MVLSCTCSQRLRHSYIWNTRAFSYQTFLYLPSHDSFFSDRQCILLLMSYVVSWGQENGPHRQGIISFVHASQFSLVVAQTKADCSGLAPTKTTLLSERWESSLILWAREIHFLIAKRLLWTNEREVCRSALSFGFFICLYSGWESSLMSLKTTYEPEK